MVGGWVWDLANARGGGGRGARQTFFGRPLDPGKEEGGRSLLAVREQEGMAWGLKKHDV
jgi:hypothetical protein